MQYSSIELDLIAYQRSAAFKERAARCKSPLQVSGSMHCDIVRSESEQELSDYFRKPAVAAVRMQVKQEVQYPIRRIYTPAAVPDMQYLSA